MASILLALSLAVFWLIKGNVFLKFWKQYPKEYARIVTLCVRLLTFIFVCSFHIYVAGISMCIGVCFSLLCASSPRYVVYYVLLHVS
jgi:hypothetical protein